MKTDLESVSPLSPLKNTLENLKISETVNAPRYQRDSIKNAIGRIKDENPKKKFSIKLKSEIVITVKRTH